MPKTEVRSHQIKDETIVHDDIAAGAVRGSTDNGGTQREISQGTVSDVDLRDDAVTAAKLDETEDFTVNSLSITTTLGVTTTSTLTGDVGIGGAPVTDAALAINSTTKALLLPTLTTTARDNIGSPQDGMFIFNSTTGTLQFYDSGWSEITVTETDPLSIHLDGSNSPSAAIDWDQQEIQQLVVHKLSSDPGSPVEGQIWYNTTEKQWKGRTDSATVILG